MVSYVLCVCVHDVVISTLSSRSHFIKIMFIPLPLPLVLFTQVHFHEAHSCWLLLLNAAHR